MNKIGRVMPFILVIGVVLSTAARILVISNVDMKTGILSHESALLCNLLYYGAVLLTAAAAAVAAGIGIKKSGGSQNPIAEGVVDAGAAVVGFGLLLVAVCAAYEGYKEIYALTPSLFLEILDFAGAVILGVIAFVTLYKKEFKPGLGFSYAFGGIYFVMRGIYCFMNRMAIVAFPEYLSEMLSVVCGAVFFVMAGKLLSSNEGKLTRGAFCFWGAGTAVMTLSEAFGAGLSKLLLSEEISERIVFTADKAQINFQLLRGVNAYYMALPSVVHIALGFFAAAGVLVLCSAKTQNNG